MVVCFWQYPGESTRALHPGFLHIDLALGGIDSHLSKKMYVDAVFLR